MADRCTICGADISSPDYYSQIRKKYCEHCAAEVKRQQMRDVMKRFRAHRREVNALTRRKCSDQEKLIDALRDEVLRLREEIRALKGSD